jgi:hypothetical protein
MNRLFGSKSTAPKPTLNSAISNVSPSYYHTQATYRGSIDTVNHR